MEITVLLVSQHSNRRPKKRDKFTVVLVAAAAATCCLCMSLMGFLEIKMEIRLEAETEMPKGLTISRVCSQQMQMIIDTQRKW